MKYELRHDWTITRDGKDLLSLHRCLTGNGQNPAGCDKEELDELAKFLVDSLNAEDE